MSGSSHSEGLSRRPTPKGVWDSGTATPGRDKEGGTEAEQQILKVLAQRILRDSEMREAGQPERDKGGTQVSRSTPPQTPERDSQSEVLREAGDLAEAIHRHCESCAVCRLTHFTTEPAPVPLCEVGRELHRRYRTARRLALAFRNGEGA